MSQQEKLTKRQRKALRGPNAMVKRSLEHDNIIHCKGVSYSGSVPRYAAIEVVIGVIQYKKVVRGVPFVRV